MKEVKNTFLIAGTFIATVIGAGFASGQEILSYFVVYGKKSIYGLMIVCVLFILCALCVMLRTYKDDINGFDEYMSVVSGTKSRIFIKACIMLFMFASFCSMTAGNGELFFENFKCERFVGAFVMMLVCFVIFLFDLKGILTVNAVLAPIMTISLFVLGLCTFTFRDQTVFANGVFVRLCENYVVSALIYASYNLLTVIVILSEMRPLIIKKSVCYAASTIGGSALFVIALSMWAAIKLYYGKIALSDIPFLTIVSRGGEGVKMFYSIILCFSMLTTAISCGYGVIEWLVSTLKIKKLAAIMILIAASYPVLLLGFTGIVRNVYSIFGYLGLVMIVYILADGVRMMNGK
ncbi:MAG: hypothetical protein E7410_03520 [Ruminococcaceae bacterium]|nr:hypothetical protein [Oscillospiraceae bacterium]